MVLVKNTLFDLSLIGKSVQCRRCPRNCKFRSFVFTLLCHCPFRAGRSENKKQARRPAIDYP